MEHKHSYTNTRKSGDTRQHGQKPDLTGKGLTLGALCLAFAQGRVNAMKCEGGHGSGKTTFGALDDKS